MKRLPFSDRSTNRRRSPFPITGTEEMLEHLDDVVGIELGNSIATSVGIPKDAGVGDIIAVGVTITVGQIIAVEVGWFMGGMVTVFWMVGVFCFSPGVMTV